MRGSRLRRWSVAAGAAAALLAALLAAGKLWIAPALIRWQIRSILPEYWDGAADVADIQFNYSGLLPLVLRGVTLRDAQGRPWFTAEAIYLAVPNWPSLRPRLACAILSSPRLTLHSSAGQCPIPLKKIPSQWWRDFVDLRSLLVQGGVAEVLGDGTPLLRSAPADALLLRRGGQYSLKLPGGTPAGGDLAIDATVEDDGVEVRHAGFAAAGGRAACRLSVRLRPPGGLEASGNLIAQGVELRRLGLSVAGAAESKLAGAVRFRLALPDANSLAGDGRAFLTGIDLSAIPVAVAVMRRAGLGQRDVLRDCDAEAIFTFRWTVATVQEGRIRLSLAAAELEPGGTLDLRTGRLNLVVVVVLFEKVRDLLKSIPLVGLMVDLTEQFSRFHVEGRWDDSPGATIASAPLAEVREGTRKFLTAAARGGGLVGRSIFGGLTGWLNGSAFRDANTPAPPPPAPPPKRP